MTAYGRNKVPELDGSLCTPESSLASKVCSLLVHWKYVFLASPSHNGHWEPRDGATSFLYHEQIGYYVANVERWKCQYICLVKNLVFGFRRS